MRTGTHLPAGGSSAVSRTSLDTIATTSVQDEQDAAPRPSLNSLLPYRHFLPPCASRCITAFLNEVFDCAVNDLLCVCRHYSSNGFTLGELAYLCPREDCPPLELGLSVPLYNICSGLPAAVPATHSTLTGTVVPEYSSTRSKMIRITSSTTTSGSHHTTHHARSSTVHTSNCDFAKASCSDARTSPSSPTHTVQSTSKSPLITSKSSTSIPSSTTSMPHSSTTSSAAPSATAVMSSMNTQSGGITNAGAAGISVGIVSALALLVGIFLLFRKLKRRRLMKSENNRNSYDFVDETPANFSPFTDGYKSPRESLKCLHDAPSDSKSNKRSLRWSNFSIPKQLSPWQYRGFDFGLGSSSPGTPRSTRSFRALSKLLPDKPDPTPLPRAMVRGKAPRLEPVDTGMTSVPEEPSQQWSQSQTPVQDNLPSFPGPIYSPPQQDEQSSTPTHSAPHAVNVQAPMQSPLFLRVPQQAAQGLKIPSTFGRPPAGRSGVRSPGVRSFAESTTPSETQSRKSNFSLLSYYGSPDAGQVSEPGYWTPVDHELPAMPELSSLDFGDLSFSAEQVLDDLSRTSSSFESEDFEEVTPPQEEEGRDMYRKTRLSTVPESPSLPLSPIHDLRYPKVPRSAAQLVPRYNSNNATPSPISPLSPINGLLRPISPGDALIATQQHTQHRQVHAPSDTHDFAYPQSQRQANIYPSKPLSRNMAINTQASPTDSFSPATHQPQTPPNLKRAHHTIRQEAPLRQRQRQDIAAGLRLNTTFSGPAPAPAPASIPVSTARVASAASHSRHPVPDYGTRRQRQHQQLMTWQQGDDIFLEYGLVT